MSAHWLQWDELGNRNRGKCSSTSTVLEWSGVVMEAQGNGVTFSATSIIKFNISTEESCVYMSGKNIIINYFFSC